MSAIAYTDEQIRAMVHRGCTDLADLSAVYGSIAFWAVDTAVEFGTHERLVAVAELVQLHEATKDPADRVI
jgi:hypothetical protein